VIKADMERIGELSATMTLTDAYLILQEVRDILRLLLLELDFTRDRRKANEAEFREFMDELWGFLDKLAAKYCVDMQLFNLVREPNAGDSRSGKEETQTQEGRVSYHRQ